MENLSFYHMCIKAIKLHFYQKKGFSEDAVSTNTQKLPNGVDFFCLSSITCSLRLWTTRRLLMNHKLGKFHLSSKSLLFRVVVCFRNKPPRQQIHYSQKIRSGFDIALEILWASKGNRTLVIDAKWVTTQIFLLHRWIKTYCAEFARKC